MEAGVDVFEFGLFDGIKKLWASVQQKGGYAITSYISALAKFHGSLSSFQEYREFLKNVILKDPKPLLLKLAEFKLSGEYILSPTCYALESLQDFVSLSKEMKSTEDFSPLTESILEELSKGIPYSGASCLLRCSMGCVSKALIMLQFKIGKNHLKAIFGIVSNDFYYLECDKLYQKTILEYDGLFKFLNTMLDKLIELRNSFEDSDLFKKFAEDIDGQIIRFFSTFLGEYSAAICQKPLKDFYRIIEFTERITKSPNLGFSENFRDKVLLKCADAFVKGYLFLKGSIADTNQTELLEFAKTLPLSAQQRKSLSLPSEAKALPVEQLSLAKAAVAPAPDAVSRSPYGFAPALAKFSLCKESRAALVGVTPLVPAEQAGPLQPEAVAETVAAVTPGQVSPK